MPHQCQYFHLIDNFDKPQRKISIKPKGKFQNQIHVVSQNPLIESLRDTSCIQNQLQPELSLKTRYRLDIHLMEECR